MKRATGWKNRKEMSEFLDISVSNFDDTVRKYAPEYAIRKEGRKLTFHARTLIEAFFKNMFMDADPDLEGQDDSPDKARLLKARADKEELIVAEKRAQLVQVTEVKHELTEIAIALRNAAHVIQQNNQDCFRILDDALSRLEESYLARQDDES